MIEENLTAGVREVVKECAGLKTDADALDVGTDLYAAGMTSFASVEVMLGLEEKFGVVFPQDMIRRSSFATIAAMAETVSQIRAQA